MAYLSHYQIPASNLLSSLTQLSQQYRVKKESLMTLALYLLFARGISLYVEKGRDEEGHMERFSGLLNAYKNLIYSTGEDHASLSRFLEFWHQLTRAFGQQGMSAVKDEEEAIDETLLQHIIRLVERPAVRISGPAQAYQLTCMLYDRVFYALNNATSDAVEVFYRDLLLGLRQGRHFKLAERPLLTGEIALPAESPPDGMVLCTRGHVSLPVLMRLALYRVEHRDGVKANLCLYRNGNAPLASSTETALRVAITEKAGHSCQALVVMKRFPSKDDFNVLMASGRLCAVIDYSIGQKTERVYWLDALNKHREVLFIDSSLIDLAQNLRPEEQAALIGGTFNASFRGTWQQYAALNEVEAVSGPLLERFFRHGYEDIDGFCRRVSYHEIHKVRQLLPGSWIKKPEMPNAFRGLSLRELFPQLTGDKKKLCHYIIGNNGVGKSYLLRDIALKFSDDNIAAAPMDEKVKVLMVASGFSDRFVDLPDEKQNGLIYLGDASASGNANVRRRDHELAKRIVTIYNCPEKRALLVRLLKQFDFTAEIYFLPPDFTIKNNQLYSDKEIHNINIIEPGNLVGVKKLKGHAIAFEKHDGEMCLFTALSSGEKQILLMLTRIIVAIAPRSVVLVDEPELSLHVAWQQRLPALFNELSQSFNSSIVVATHSPVLITATSPQNNVCYLATPGRLTEIERSSLGNLESTLLEAFNIVTRNNRSVYERCASAVAGFMQTLNQQEKRAIVQQKKLSLQELQVLESKLVNNPVKTASHESDLRLVQRAQSAIEELAASVAQGSRS